MVEDGLEEVHKDSLVVMHPIGAQGAVSGIAPSDSWLIDAGRDKGRGSSSSSNLEIRALGQSRREWKLAELWVCFPSIEEDQQ